MGSNHSKFIEALRMGSGEEARMYYTTKKSLRDSMEPNTPLGATHGENSVLHYAALHAMEWLYRDLLLKGGKPDMRNEAAQNSLHLVCMNNNRKHSRETILHLILTEGLYGMDVEHILRERDESGNTALHLAASAGLNKCVELLLANKADLYITNKKEQTAADCAAESKQITIATLLETRMVFSVEDGSNSASSMEPDHTHLMELAEAPSGMRDSDLRTLKDQLLIETSELLGISLFTSEALLRHHGWSKEELLDAWMENARETCEKAGVELPSNLGTHNLDTPISAVVGSDRGRVREIECAVCLVEFSPDIKVPCGHTFCRDCWRQYLHLKIETGDTHSIICPQYACFKLVPLEVIEAVVSKEMAQRYLRFDIKAFVDSHPTIRWCPHPDCHRAVRLTTPPSNASDAEPTTVHCGNEHYFCWSCSGDPHVPVSCDDWKKWLNHVKEMSPQIGEKTSSQLDDAASQRWLAARSKPCPKCRAPIEKNDGCNHMCCKKCRHDFCWVCLDEWKHHNTSTGGYFECNRYDVRRKADSQLQKHKEEVLDGVEEAEQLRRFIHYYERFKSHRESLQLEQPFLEKANQKMEKLRVSVQKYDTSSKYTVSVDMSFIEEAIRELLASRRILIASYPFGYYVKGKHGQRLFENMQGTLEQVTELLAQVVARPYLRKPRTEIIRITRECREKRMWLIKDCKTLPGTTPLSSTKQLLRFGRALDSDSSGNNSPTEDSIDEVFMRLLRGHRRRSERRHHDPGQELLQAMELSRQEHAETTQLDADIERAKQLSLADKSQTSAQPTATSGLIFLGDDTRSHVRTAPGSHHHRHISSPFLPPSQRSHNDSPLPSRSTDHNITPASRLPQTLPRLTSSTPPSRFKPYTPFDRPFLLNVDLCSPQETSPPCPLPVPSPPSAVQSEVPSVVSSTEAQSKVPSVVSSTEAQSEVPSVVSSTEADNSTSNDSDHSEGWDDEEIATALSLSLMESTTTQPSLPSESGAHGGSRGDDLLQLLPELRYLLQDSSRTGQNV